MDIKHEKTIEILKWFEEINKIPRASKKEEQISRWLMDWAAQHQLEAKLDNVGNVLINVPPSTGYENAPPVVLQGHMDMVCEKTPDSPHDFDKDPIALVYDGQWLTADRTTLGADNGIALAMGMTLALDKGAKHPPLELLFTVDEETAGTGAFSLEPDFVKGRRMINLDSEEEGVFTVGCAGGEKNHHRVPLAMETLPPDHVSLTIAVDGLAGGHSADIHHEKANALKVLGRTLHAILGQVEIRLAAMTGGSAHNAIPRNASAIIYLDPAHTQKARDAVLTMEKTLHREFKNTDPDLKLNLSEGSMTSYFRAVTAADTRKAILLTLAMPHGIYAMSTEIERAVESSNNFASFHLCDGELRIVTGLRSPIESRLDDLGLHIRSVIELAGGTSESHDRYPGWHADMLSPLLKKCTKVYENLYGKKPLVESTHGGLECGAIGDKLKGMDMISFGPTIKDPHSPDERMHIPDIGRVWDFMVALLAELK